MTEDSNGIQTHLAYNSRGWLISKSVKTPQGDATTSYTYAHSGNYEGQGQIASITLPNGDTVYYQYDKAYRLIGTRNSRGERIDYTLDLEGNRIGETIYNASGELVRSQRQAFDELSRLLSSIGADQQTTTYQYDKNGNLVGTVDSMNHRTQHTFDGLNRLVATTDANQGVIKRTYNDQHMMTHHTDQRGLTTEYRYNGFGEKVTQISPDTGTTHYQYNRAGQLIKETDARDKVTEYHYDMIGRMVQVHYPAANDEDIIYAYDQQANGSYGVGRLAQVNDPSGYTRYEYNAQGQISQQQYAIGATSYTVHSHYNVAGELTGMTYPSGRTVNYLRDTQGRIQQVSTRTANDAHARPVINRIGYLPFGPLEDMVYGNGTELQIRRDRDYRMMDMTLSANDSLYYAAAYDYDKAGNITAIHQPLDQDHSEHFSYDALYRLVSAQGHYGSIDYDYDAVGNRLSLRKSEKDSLQSTLETYEYANDSNRLLTVAEHKGTYAQQRVLDYDAVGNIINDQRAAEQNLALVYGVNNRLQAVSKDNGHRAQYIYNAKGQRVSKIVRNADGSIATTHFHYNHHDQLMAETNGQGSPIREYLYVNQERVAVVDYQEDTDGQLAFIHNDHLGTPKLMTDAQQQLIWQDQSLPFGEIENKVAAIEQPLKFPGQYADAETGFHYNYFRDYDPSLGRYIQSDPIGLKGGVNTFGYVLGNPLAYSDPNGLCPTGGFICGAVAAIGTYIASQTPDAVVSGGANFAVEYAQSGDFNRASKKGALGVVMGYAPGYGNGLQSTVGKTYLGSLTGSYVVDGQSPLTIDAQYSAIMASSAAALTYPFTTYKLAGAARWEQLALAEGVQQSAGYIAGETRSRWGQDVYQCKMP